MASLPPRARRAIVAVAFALAAGAAEVGAATIAIAPSSVVAAYTESGSDSVFPANVPQGAAVYSFSGAASATLTDYDVTDPDAGIHLGYRHRHDPTGAYGPFPVVACDPFCAGSTATIRFQTASPLGYRLSAWYAASDDHGRDVAFAVELRDLTLGVSLFAYEESRVGFPDARFETGLVTGVLLPGRSYELTLAAALRSDAIAVDQALAEGSLALSFEAIPEPGTAVATSVGLTWLASARRRRRR